MNMCKALCPQCGSKLKKLIYGYIEDEMIPPESIHMGCLCFGDDRDGEFYCDKCSATFSKSLSPIKLISCPLEASNAIFSFECRQYDLLHRKSHYELLEDIEKVCTMICPAIGKQAIITLTNRKKIAGKLHRTYRYTKDVPYNHLSISQKTDRYHSTFTDIPISDILSISITSEK